MSTSDRMCQAERLSRAMSYLDEDIIEEAVRPDGVLLPFPVPARRKHLSGTYLRVISVAAACLLLTVSTLVILLPALQKAGTPSENEGDSVSLMVTCPDTEACEQWIDTPADSRPAYSMDQEPGCDPEPDQTYPLCMATEPVPLPQTEVLTPVAETEAIPGDNVYENLPLPFPATAVQEVATGLVTFLTHDPMTHTVTLTLTIYRFGAPVSINVYGTDGLLASTADGRDSGLTIKVDGITVGNTSLPTAPGTYQIAICYASVLPSIDGTDAGSLQISADDQPPVPLP